MNKKNIIVGAAQLYLGPALEVPDGGDVAAAVSDWRPDAVAGTSYATTLEADADWRGVGYTQDGLTVATSPSWGEVAVDQLLDSAKIFKDGMSLTISTTFVEATLENLLIAWGQSGTATVDGSASQIDIDGGSLGEAPLERGLIAIGNAVEGSTNSYGERTYFAYRVLSVDASTHVLSRADATTIPVSFRALPADNGKYGSVRDRLNVSDEVGAVNAPSPTGPLMTLSSDAKVTEEPTAEARKAAIDEVDDTKKSDTKKKS